MKWHKILRHSAFTGHQCEFRAQAFIDEQLGVSLEPHGRREWIPLRSGEQASDEPQVDKLNLKARSGVPSLIYPAKVEM
jgi:hypothetical protein